MNRKAGDAGDSSISGDSEDQRLRKRFSEAATAADRSTNSVRSDDSGPLPDDDRARHRRELNRLSKSRCRKRRKETLDSLETQVNELTAENHALQQLNEQLRLELWEALAMPSQQRSSQLLGISRNDNSSQLPTTDALLQASRALVSQPPARNTFPQPQLYPDFHVANVFPENIQQATSLATLSYSNQQIGQYRLPQTSSPLDADVSRAILNSLLVTSNVHGWMSQQRQMTAAPPLFSSTMSTLELARFLRPLENSDNQSLSPIETSLPHNMALPSADSRQTTAADGKHQAPPTSKCLSSSPTNEHARESNTK